MSPRNVPNTKIMALQNVCHLITDGKHGDCQNEENSGYYFLSAKDVRDNKLTYENARQITEEDFLQTHRRTRLEPLDILIVSTGATIGRMALVPNHKLTTKTTFQKSVAIIKPNQQLVDPHWLFYKLSHDKELLINLSGGTAQGNLLLRDLREFKVGIPHLPTQRKIADILSAYDDLIENNTRRIRILEQMAQAVYREWFVHFRFPGHVGVKMVDGVPEGWEIKRFTDVIDVMSGGTPKTTESEYWGNEIPWFTPQDISKAIYVLDTERKITKLGLSKCNSKLYPAGTVFITARGTVGKVVMAAVPMAMSQTSYALLGQDDIPQQYVYLLTLSLVEQFKKNATGAVFDTIIVDTFRGQSIIVPPKDILVDFGRIIRPVFSMIQNLQKKNTNLRRTRDLLLPRLVGGEIDMGAVVNEMNGKQTP